MRQASDSTRLRYAKSHVNSLKRYQASLIAELKDRRRYGGMLANIAFNLAQRTDDEHLRGVLDECRKAWDEIRKVPL